MGAAPARNDAKVGARGTRVGSSWDGSASEMRDACHNRQALIGSSIRWSTSTGGSQATSA